MTPADTAQFERLGSTYPSTTTRGLRHKSIQTQKSDWKAITNGGIPLSPSGPPTSTTDSVVWDIGPGAFGWDGFLPGTIEEARDYYAVDGVPVAAGVEAGTRSIR